MAYPPSAPPLSKSPSSSSESSNSGISPSSSPPTTTSTSTTLTSCGTHKSLAVLSGHTGSVSCLALCGEFLLSASTSNEIIVWQQPDLRPFTRFGHSETDGLVKSLVAVGNRVFSAHQDARIRVWKVSRRSPENIFKLIATLPTKKDYWGKFLRQSNYVQTRRNHKKLWIQHADSISCLAVYKGLVYSGSWDKTLKVWRVSDLKCLESIKAHDDAINALVAHDGLVYSASADGKIKVWGKSNLDSHWLMGCLEGNRDVCWNSVIVFMNGRMVYGGGSDGRVVGWERGEKGENWRLVFDVKAHELSVLCLCSTGEFVCSGSADKSIGVWREEEGGGGGRLCKIGVIRGHEAPVKCLQASEIGVGGGFMLYSGGLDKSLRVWWVPREYKEVEDERGNGEGEGQGMEKCNLLR